VAPEHVPWCALDGTETAGAADLAPEGRQLLAGAVAPATAPPVRECHGVHRAGAGAGDRVEAQTPILEQRVEHPPAEGAVRTAALKRDVDWLGGHVAGLTAPSSRRRSRAWSR